MAFLTFETLFYVTFIFAIAINESLCADNNDKVRKHQEVICKKYCLGKTWYNTDAVYDPKSESCHCFNLTDNSYKCKYQVVLNEMILTKSDQCTLGCKLKCEGENFIFGVYHHDDEVYPNEEHCYCYTSTAQRSELSIDLNIQMKEVESFNENECINMCGIKLGYSSLLVLCYCFIKEDGRKISYVPYQLAITDSTTDMVIVDSKDIHKDVDALLEKYKTMSNCHGDRIQHHNCNLFCRSLHPYSNGIYYLPSDGCRCALTCPNMNNPDTSIWETNTFHYQFIALTQSRECTLECKAIELQDFNVGAYNNGECYCYRSNVNPFIFAKVYPKFDDEAFDSKEQECIIFCSIKNKDGLVPYSWRDQLECKTHCKCYEKSRADKTIDYKLGTYHLLRDVGLTGTPKTMISLSVSKKIQGKMENLHQQVICEIYCLAKTWYNTGAIYDPEQKTCYCFNNSKKISKCKYQDVVEKMILIKSDQCTLACKLMRGEKFIFGVYHLDNQVQPNQENCYCYTSESPRFEFSIDVDITKNDLETINEKECDKQCGDTTLGYSSSLGLCFCFNKADGQRTPYISYQLTDPTSEIVRLSDSEDFAFLEQYLGGNVKGFLEGFKYVSECKTVRIQHHNCNLFCRSLHLYFNGIYHVPSDGCNCAWANRHMDNPEPFIWGSITFPYKKIALTKSRQCTLACKAIENAEFDIGAYKYGFCHCYNHDIKVSPFKRAKMQPHNQGSYQSREESCLTFCWNDTLVYDLLYDLVAYSLENTVEGFSQCRCYNKSSSCKDIEYELNSYHLI